MGKLVSTLAVVLVLVACGESRPLTLEEYGDFCTKIDEMRFDDGIKVGESWTWGRLSGAMSRVVDEYKSVNPPPELRDYHEAKKRNHGILCQHS